MIGDLSIFRTTRFEQDGQSKRPIFPYDDLVIRPFGAVDEGTVTPA